MTTQKKVLNKARGLYRWERGEGWPEERDDMTTFEQGQAVTIDPFKNATVNDSPYFWPVFCTFLEYVTEDIARVYIPEEGEDSRTWFKEEAGEYLIHEGYLTPQ